MKILCIGYRKWALSIYDQVKKKNPDHNFLIFRSKEEFNKKLFYEFSPNIVLFYGWSWIIDTQILSDFRCIMLHPSPLPKYRGGSPIQNQIINGEKKSAVTLFIMDKGIDTGPIIAQENFNLDGDLNQILDEITSLGVKLTNRILNREIIPIPQNNDEATYFRRRKPKDSELTMDELKNKPAEYLYNKIRMLQDPYPNAYIKTADNKKLYITKASIFEKS